MASEILLRHDNEKFDDSQPQRSQDDKSSQGSQDDKSSQRSSINLEPKTLVHQMLINDYWRIIESRMSPLISTLPEYSMKSLIPPSFSEVPLWLESRAQKLKRNQTCENWVRSGGKTFDIDESDEDDDVKDHAKRSRNQQFQTYDRDDDESDLDLYDEAKKSDYVEKQKKKLTELYSQPSTVRPPVTPVSKRGGREEQIYNNDVSSSLKYRDNMARHESQKDSTRQIQKQLERQNRITSSSEIVDDLKEKKTGSEMTFDGQGVNGYWNNNYIINGNDISSSPSNYLKHSAPQQNNSNSPEQLKDLDNDVTKEDSMMVRQLHETQDSNVDRAKIAKLGSTRSVDQGMQTENDSAKQERLGTEPGRKFSLEFDDEEDDNLSYYTTNDVLIGSDAAQGSFANPISPRSDSEEEAKILSSITRQKKNKLCLPAFDDVDAESIHMQSDEDSEIIFGSPWDMSETSRNGSFRRKMENGVNGRGTGLRLSWDASIEGRGSRISISAYENLTSSKNISKPLFMRMPKPSEDITPKFGDGEIDRVSDLSEDDEASRSPPAESSNEDDDDNDDCDANSVIVVKRPAAETNTKRRHSLQRTESGVQTDDILLLSSLNQTVDFSQQTMTSNATSATDNVELRNCRQSENVTQNGDVPSDDNNEDQASKYSSKSNRSNVDSLYPDTEDLLRIARRVELERSMSLSSSGGSKSSSQPNITQNETTKKANNGEVEIKQISEEKLKQAEPSEKIRDSKSDSSTKQIFNTLHEQKVPTSVQYDPKKSVFLLQQQQHVTSPDNSLLNMDKPLGDQQSDDDVILSLDYETFELLYNVGLVTRSQVNSGKVSKAKLADIENYLQSHSLPTKPEQEIAEELIPNRSRDLVASLKSQLSIDCGPKNIEERFYRRDYVINKLNDDVTRKHSTDRDQQRFNSTPVSSLNGINSSQTSAEEILSPTSPNSKSEIDELSSMVSVQRLRQEFLKKQESLTSSNPTQFLQRHIPMTSSASVNQGAPGNSEIILSETPQNITRMPDVNKSQTVHVGLTPSNAGHSLQKASTVTSPNIPKTSEVGKTFNTNSLNVARSLNETKKVHSPAVNQFNSVYKSEKIVEARPSAELHDDTLSSSVNKSVLPSVREMQKHFSQTNSSSVDSEDSPFTRVYSLTARSRSVQIRREQQRKQKENQEKQQLLQRQQQTLIQHQKLQQQQQQHQQLQQQQQQQHKQYDMKKLARSGEPKSTVSANKDDSRSQLENVVKTTQLNQAYLNGKSTYLHNGSPSQVKNSPEKTVKAEENKNKVAASSDIIESTKAANPEVEETSIKFSELIRTFSNHS